MSNTVITGLWPTDKCVDKTESWVRLLNINMKLTESHWFDDMAKKRGGYSSYGFIESIEDSPTPGYNAIVLHPLEDVLYGNYVYSALKDWDLPFFTDDGHFQPRTAKEIYDEYMTDKKDRQEYISPETWKRLRMDAMMDDASPEVQKTFKDFVGDL